MNLLSFKLKCNVHKIDPTHLHAEPLLRVPAQQKHVFPSSPFGERRSAKLGDDEPEKVFEAWAS